MIANAIAENVLGTIGVSNEPLSLGRFNFSMLRRHGLLDCTADPSAMEKLAREVD